MANYFTETPDLLFHFEHGGLRELADAVEGDYSDHARFPEAPINADDAVDSYRRILESLGALAAEFIAPRAEEVDRIGCRLDEEGRVHLAPGTVENLQMLTRAELMGFTLPREYGGINLPGFLYVIANEMVSRADASLMNLFGLQGVAETVNDFADEEIKRVYLPRFTSGEATGAMVLTEPDAGSDLQRVQLRAEQDEHGAWRLNGVKRFITNGCGEILLVLARSEPEREGAQGLSLFLVEKGPAVRVRRLEEKLGIHGSPTCELQFDNTPGLLIGKRQRGLITYVMALMNGARVGVAAQGLGIAQAALDAAVDYAAVRRQFGKPINEFPAVADMLADMVMEVEASRALVYETARVVDQVRGAALAGDRARERALDRLAALLTPMAKYYASEMSIRVATDAVQVLGGSGYMRDYPVERLLRDARITTIYEGTSQLQVVAAIRGVTSGLAESRFAELGEGLAGSEAAPLLERLAAARADLAAAVETAKQTDDTAYLDLVARPLVDLTCGIYMGYLLADQSRHSERKQVLARRWLDRLGLTAATVRRRVESMERSALDHRDLLTHT